MKWIDNKLYIKYIFSFIWFFFIARINFYINIEKNLYQFDFINWFYFCIDFLSICILVFLIIYLANIFLAKKKFPITVILLLYPISGLIGHFNNNELYFNTVDIWHHFITLSSVILFLIITDSSKIFDYKFYELLLKILIILVIIFFLIKIFPLIIFKFYHGIDLRLTYFDNILLGNFLNIPVTQNINGQARILFILQLFFLIIFKNNIFKKYIIANIFFLFSLIFLLFIFLMQSRFTIIVSSIFFIFIILKINNLSVIKKFFYMFFLFIIIILSIYNNKHKRFVNINDESYILAKTRTAHGDNTGLNNASTQNINNASTQNSIILYSASRCSLTLNKLDIILSGRLCGWEILLKNINKRDLFFGKGFFIDQKLLKPIQKTSSNSWINILFNTGIISLTIILTFIIFFLFKYFKFKDINDQNIYISFSYYLLIFVLWRSLLEDTIAFVNIDLIILIATLLIIKNSSKKNYNIKENVINKK
jgi:hypothetical protein